MAVPNTDVIEQHHRLCVKRALELGHVDFVVKGGLICASDVEAFDTEGERQFRFYPPTVRIATEHWEFAGELYLYETDVSVARGALVWLEKTSDYLCLATAGAPVKMEPFQDMLDQRSALPPSHPREIWYDEVTAGRTMTDAMLVRANTFMWLAQRLRSDVLTPYQRSLWWFRHGANIEIESPALAYVSLFNSLEVLLRYETSNERRGKPTRNRATRCQFESIFGDQSGNELYQLCYGAKDESLYDLRNEIDHGNIVELGSGMLEVLENLALVKAVVIDLALYWIGRHKSFGGWISKGVVTHGSKGLVMLSAEEAEQAFGKRRSGPADLGS